MLDSTLGWFTNFFPADLTPLNSGSGHKTMISVKKVRVIIVKNRRSLASKFMTFLFRKVPWEKPPPYEVNKKVQKRTFPAIFSKKVTSKTHLNIGFYLNIVESFGKNGYFLLNKLVEAADFCMFQYITLLHKL